jgi:hypothetical protein
MLPRLASLLAIPLAITSVGYALFTQNLSINTSTIKPAYSSSQGLRVTYSRSVAPAGQNFTHTLNPITISNLGGTGVTAWQFVFTLPAGYSNLSCTNATCTPSGNVITMVNSGSNGTINPGGSVTVSMSFRTSLQRYTLQNVSISGTLVLTYQTISGLTVSRTVGARTKSGQWYRWPYTFTVTNNTGQTLRAWRITATPWAPATNRVNLMPAGVTFVSGASSLVMTRVATFNTGTNYVFTTNLESTDINWALTAYPVEGAL